MSFNSNMLPSITNSQTKAIPTFSTIQSLLREHNAMEVASDENSRWEMPQTAVLVLIILVLLAAICLCASAVLKRKRFNAAEQAEDGAEQEPDIIVSNQQKMTSSSWATIRMIVRGLVCRPESMKQEKSERKDRQGIKQEIGGPRLDMQETTASPLWQRRILMGERCEMPRFSGLILYDEKGLPICDDDLPQLSSKEQRKQMRAERTTARTEAAAGSTAVASLKDLLSQFSHGVIMFSVDK